MTMISTRGMSRYRSRAERGVGRQTISLEKEGIALRPGDLLSRGGYLPAAPTQAGTSVMAKYLGLRGDPSVTVHFE
jgi:hypothetical protein